MRLDGAQFVRIMKTCQPLDWKRASPCLKLTKNKLYFRQDNNLKHNCDSTELVAESVRAIHLGVSSINRLIVMCTINQLLDVSGRAICAIASSLEFCTSTLGRYLLLIS